MSKSMRFGAALGLALLTVASASAQLAEKKVITLAAARKMVAAAEAEAERSDLDATRDALDICFAAGFRHDPCSAVHPLGAGSPLLTRLPLRRYGLRWLHPQIPLEDLDLLRKRRSGNA